MLGIAYVLNLVITSLVFVPRAKSFMGKLSVADVMRELYGKNVELITSIASVGITISLV